MVGVLSPGHEFVCLREFRSRWNAAGDERRPESIFENFGFVSFLESGHGHVDDDLFLGREDVPQHVGLDSAKQKRSQDFVEFGHDPVSSLVV